MNAELRRFLWTDFTLNRVLAMPTVILSVVALMFVSRNITFTTYGYSDITSQAILVFAIIAIGLGGRAASKALYDDIQEGTWDFQRLSSMTPFALAFGKFFGCIAYSWFGAVIALAIVALTLISFHTLQDTLIYAGLAAMGAIVFQMAVFFVGLQTWPASQPSRRRSHNVAVHIPAVLSAAFFFFALDSYVAPNSKPWITTWWNVSYCGPFFALSVLTLSSLWLGAGIYARMRTHLQMTRLPMLWPGFCLFAIVLTAGLASDPIQPDPNRVLSTAQNAAILVSLLLVYSSAVFESWDALLYRRLFRAILARQYRTVFDIVPNWIVASAIAAVVILWSAVCEIFLSPPGAAVTFAMLFFVTRDIGLLHYFMLQPSRKRAVANVLIWMIVLYGVLPIILFKLNCGDLSISMVSNLASLVPQNTALAYVSPFAALGEAGAIAILIRKLWLKSCPGLPQGHLDK